MTRSLALNTLSALFIAAAPLAAQTWTGAASGSWSNAANWSPAGVPASDSGTQLVFGATPNPGMTDDIAGAFILNSLTFNAGAPTYALGAPSGSSLNLQTSAAGNLPQIVQNSANGVTITGPLTLSNNLTVSGGGNLTLTGGLNGPGGLTMNGSGTLSLFLGNTYSGGTNVQAGTVQVSSDSTLGTGNVTGGSLGTVAFIATMPTTKSFAMGGGTMTVAAGKTVTFNGGAVSGVYLDGAGTFATDPTNGAKFVNASTTPSVSITSASANDQFIHFTNSGTMSFAAGLNTNGTGTTVNFNGFFNQGTGSLTIGAASTVNVSNFQSYGILMINPATVGASPHQQTVLKNLGTSVLGFNGGSRTKIGTPQTAVYPNNWPDPSLRGQPTFVAGIDLNGKNAIVTDGIFVGNGFVIDSSNNGTGTATVIAHYGSLVVGQYFQNPPQTIPGGRFEVSVGTTSFGSLVLGSGGVNTYVFAIDDAAGTPGATPIGNGPASGWGLARAVRDVPGGPKTPGDVTWTATPASPLQVSLATIINPSGDGDDTPGPMANFDPSRPYIWQAVRWDGNYLGPADAATLDASTAFDTSGFLNPIAGTFGWQLDAANNTLSLTYTPTTVPEPSTLTLVTAAAAGLPLVRRRRNA
jgi:autotransporter-associated beta strand protein